MQAKRSIERNRILVSKQVRIDLKTIVKRKARILQILHLDQVLTKQSRTLMIILTKYGERMEYLVQLKDDLCQKVLIQHTRLDLVLISNRLYSESRIKSQEKLRGAAPCSYPKQREIHIPLSFENQYKTKDAKLLPMTIN